MPITIDVDLKDRSYPVRVGPGGLDDLPAVIEAVGGVSSAAVISDSNVAKLYGRRVVEAIARAAVPVSLLDFPAGEQNKTLATYGALFDALFALSPAVGRDSLVVALGGGVVGDVAGFVAATALRGLRWLQCPTTLLADVDASVGGKTAVDHPAGKNLIGAFHQPHAVVIDTGTLRTLPEPELRNGLAECVKHAVIRDADLLGFIDRHVEPIRNCDVDVMTELVARNVAIKAAVVSADEREAGERAHLNFGHTIGHGIETCVGYGRISHGQAVSLGMVAACHMAVSRGLIEPDLAERIRSVLVRLGLPVSFPGLDAGAIWEVMQHDKKARGGQVRMVLPTAMGQVAVFDDVAPGEVRTAVSHLAP